jgi:hypothetical protein
MSGTGVIAIIPSWGGLDFVLRFAVAGLAASYATYARKAWLAYAAAAITCPILAFSRLAPLVALWRFRQSADRDQAPDSAIAPDTATA